MAKKIVIDIEVNGKMQKATVSAKKLANALNNTQESARTTDRRLKGVSQQSANSTKNFSKMAQGISGGLVPAYATLAAQVFAITALFGFLRKAADFRVITESQVAFSSVTGVGMRSLTKEIQRASDSMLTFQSSAEAAAIGVASGLGASQIAEFAKGAKNLSIILGRDVTDSFNRLIRGVTKAEPELLDELGITLRLADATERYATTLGKAAKDLSNYEKRQAIAFDVQKQLDEKINSAAEGADIQTNAIAKLGVAFDTMLKPVNKFISDISEPTAEFFVRNIESLTAALFLLAVPIVKAIIPGLDDFANSAQENLNAAKLEVAGVKKELEELDIAAQKLKQSGSSPAAAAQEALTGVKSKAKSVVALQRGESIDPKQAQALLRNAKKGIGPVKNMVKEMRVQYIAALEAMVKNSERGFTTIGRQIKKVESVASRSFKRIELAWKQTTTAMTRLSSGFAKATNLIFRVAGFIGIITMLVQLTKEMGKFIGLFEENKEVNEYAAAVERLRERMADTSKEFVDLAENQEKLLRGIDESDTRFGNRGLLAATAAGNYAGQVRILINDIFETLDKEKDINKKLNELTQIAVEPLELSQSSAFEPTNLQQAYMGQANAQNNAIKNIGDSLKTFTSDMVTSTPRVKELRAELFQMSSQMRLVLEASDEMTDELSKLLTALGRGELSETQRKQLNKLLEDIEEGGKGAKFLLEQQEQINNAVTKRLNTLNQFQSSVTSILNLIDDQIDMEKKLTKEGYEERVRLLEEQRRQMKIIHDMELQHALKMSALASKRESDKRGRIGGVSVRVPTLLGGELGRQNAITEANIAVKKAEDAIRAATMSNVTTDPTQLKILTNELDRAKAAAQNLKDELGFTGRMLDGIVQSFETGMASAIEGLITGTMSIREAFASMATAVLQMIAKMIAEMIALRIVSSFLGMPTGPTFADGSAMSSLKTPTGIEFGPANRYGGVMSNGKKAPGYAVGGIAKGPQAGYPAVLHGTEAVVPLPNGKSIPVDMKAAGQQNNVTVNVAIDGQGNARGDTQADSNEGSNLGSAIAAAVQKELLNQKRAGGILNPMGVS